MAERAEVAQLAQVVVVTGTGTGIGKTVATAALAAEALRAGRSVGVVKPVQTGVSNGVGDGRDDDPGDVHEVARLVASLGRVEARELLRLPEPMAPQAAARRAGVGLPALSEHVAAIEKLSAQHDLVLVEGAGGVLVRLDDAGATIADLALALAAEVVLVAEPGLGTLNVTELSAEALRSRGVRVRGVLIGRWPTEPDPVAWENLVDLPRLTGLPLLGVVPQLRPGEVPRVAAAPTHSRPPVQS